MYVIVGITGQIGGVVGRALSRAGQQSRGSCEMLAKVGNGLVAM